MGDVVEVVESVLHSSGSFSHVCSESRLDCRTGLDSSHMAQPTLTHIWQSGTRKERKNTHVVHLKLSGLQAPSLRQAGWCVKSSEHTKHTAVLITAYNLSGSLGCTIVRFSTQCAYLTTLCSVTGLLIASSSYNPCFTNGLNNITTKFSRTTTHSLKKSHNDTSKAPYLIP